jgi:hypothetical protein
MCSGGPSTILAKHMMNASPEHEWYPIIGVTARFVQNRTLRVRRNRKRTVTVQCNDHSRCRFNSGTRSLGISQGPRCRRSKISSIRRPPVLNRTRATLDGVSDIKAYISTWALGLKLAMRSVGLPLGGPVRQSFCPLTRCASAFPDILGVTAQRSFGGPTPPLMSSGAHRPRKYPKGSQMFALSVV